MTNMKIIIPAVISLIILIIFADYSGWLGVRTSTEQDYFGVRFAAEDEQSGEKIIDFFINCTRKGSRNACSIQQGQNKPTREAKFGVIKLIKKTWLFNKGESIVGEDEVDVHLMFIHQDYNRRTDTYSMKQLLSMQNEIVRVKLTRSSI
ncbi:MAG: hypothetical protein AB8D52_01780 [Gammaproteobacteria bacterium]